MEDTCWSPPTWDLDAKIQGSDFQYKRYPKDFRKKALKIHIKIISGQYLRREVEGDVKVNLNP